MNFQPIQEKNLPNCLASDPDNLAEVNFNRSRIELKRLAPNKVIMATSDCTWLLEDNSQFHFAEFN